MTSPPNESIQVTPPLSVDAVTAAWLTQCLRDDGYDAVVSGFAPSPIGAGMLGSTHRLRMAFSRTDARAPTSVVLKVNGEGELSQKLGKIGYGFKGKPGFYASEVYFYRAIAARTAIRRPACHFSWISDDGGRFCLLLEDIAPARAGDELEGCALSEAHIAMANLAGLHATMWDDPALRAPGPVERINADDARRFEGYYRNAAAVFRERHADRFAPEVLTLVDALAEAVTPWFLADDQPSALAHGDYRLDNMLFTTGEPVQCVAVDWQSFTVANPAFDVGYVLGASVPTAVRRGAETALLRSYHDRLVALGVGDYPFDACARAFASGAFFGVKNMVIALRSVTMTDRGRDMLDHLLRQACATIGDHGGARLLG